MAQNGKKNRVHVVTAGQITAGQRVCVWLFIKIQMNAFIVEHILLSPICFASDGATSTRKKYKKILYKENTHWREICLFVSTRGTVTSDPVIFQYNLSVHIKYGN